MTRLRLIAGSIVSVVVFAFVSAAAAVGDVPSGPVSWLSTGDSYSSGEGVFGNRGACAQSDEAWGPATVARLSSDEYRWTIGPVAFTACTGQLIEDFFNPRDSGKDSLYQWGLEQGVPERTDVIALSFGGNDIGFADLIFDCITLPDSWGRDVLSGLTGCDWSEDVVMARIDALLEPPATGCVGGRATKVVDNDPYLCDLLIGPDPGNRGTYVDFLVQLAENNLTSRGRIYLAGYPAITAPTSEWGVWNTFMCGAAQIKRGDAQRLERLAWRLDGALKTAVEQANQRLGTERVVYVSRFEVYRDGSHELCGRGEHWINGLTKTRGEGITFRPSGSFHPNQAGHAATADYVAKNIGLRSGVVGFEPVTYATPLSMTGMAGVRVGMTLSQAEAATAQVLDFDFLDGHCFYAGIQNLEGVSMLMDGEGPDSSASDGIVSRISLWSPEFSTDVGIRVGASEADLLKRLGTELVASQHEYVEDGIYYDLFRPSALPEPVAMRFTVEEGVVASIHAGFEDFPSLVEGCF